MNSEVAHDLITLHMLRWLAKQEEPEIGYCMDGDEDVRRTAGMVADALRIDLAPWPGGE